ncbi:hypothetical protein DFJ67_6823 [Asanoa ferruginea]|uniref:Uncharacterized protein n=1 Tax=Asanoa ferruginea TaxID=53367 RepID=A0A3D9ZUA7_9ACTN|nr:hypothetical protein [Asanoa ferruginea]REG00766.1 hypothetical protein DFJ67_6823 [Asanoa ferruginea]GIF47360.1 hypothetical protein Afe04nite_18990 [Asanoa ferruginea]
MSYDVTIAAHRAMRTDLVEAWAGERSLALAKEPDHLVLGSPSSGEFIEVWGPDPAEADDFDEMLAAACLAPRWMVQLSTTAGATKATITLLRTLARHIAEQTDGAAMDPRRDGLIWPRGRRKMAVPAVERSTSMVRMDWFVPPSRWADAAGQIVDLLARRCPEALPTRYGHWEPPPHRFDRAEPQPFTEAVRGAADDYLFWRASRPCFGGSANPPNPAAGDERPTVGRIELSFDGGLVRADDRWREALVDLFATAARTFGAFFAAAQEEPGHLVSRNRSWPTKESLTHSAEHILNGQTWQGLPPVPMWLSWYGRPYADLVTPGLVRASEQIRPRADLPAVVPPPELTYRHRPAIVGADGSVSTDPPRPGDQASFIPDLEGI